MMVALLFGLMFLLMFLGVPIAFAVCAANVIYLLNTNLLPLTVLGQSMYVGLDSFVRLAVPLFILCGYLMESFGLSKRLIDFVECFLGRFQGSMGIVTIVTCTIFAALTGSGPATVAAMSAIMLPALLKQGYTEGAAAGCIAAGGGLGPIIPPSIGMIVYGAQMEMNIPKMFSAAMIPGLLLALSMIITNQVLVKRWHMATTPASYTVKERLVRTKDAIGVLFLPVIILGGIYSGIFTPTESAAVACMYSLILGLIYHQLSIKKIISVVKRTVVTTSTVGLILCMTQLLSLILSYTQTPAHISNAVISIVHSKYLYILILVLIMLVVGCFMETLSSIAILAPILVPIGIQLGIDELHIAMIFCITLIIGIITPPFGVNIFTCVSATDIPYDKVVRGTIPYLIGIIFVILLVAFVPPLTTWLPSLMYQS